MQLYLDTARMGRFCAESQGAVQDYLRLHGRGSTAEFVRLIRRGFAAMPAEFRERYRGLRHWPGLAALGRLLGQLVGASPLSTVLLAASSGQLLGVVAQAMLRRCQRILLPDVAWRDYRSLLTHEAASMEAETRPLELLRGVRDERWEPSRIVDYVRRSFLESRCDGILLPAITDQGIRMPVADIVAALRETGRLRFVVVDGAQDFCHAPTRFEELGCDVYLSGSHKWLNAHLPLRFAICRTGDASRIVDATWDRLVNSRRVLDPVLRFTRQLQQGAVDPYSETVDLLPAISCAAAAAAARANLSLLDGRFRARLRNAAQLAASLADLDWHAWEPHPELRSGIVVLTHRGTQDRARGGWDAGRAREILQSQGVVATAYPDRRVRISVPARKWTSEQIQVVRKAFAACTIGFRLTASA